MWQMILLSWGLPLWTLLLPLCTVKLRFDPFFSFSGVQSLRSTQSLAQECYRRNEVFQVVQWSWPQQQLLLLLSTNAFFSHCCIQTSFCHPCLWSLDLTHWVWLLSVVITLLEVLWLFNWTYKRCSLFTSASFCRQIFLDQNSQGQSKKQC